MGFSSPDSRAPPPKKIFKKSAKWFLRNYHLFARCVIMTPCMLKAYDMTRGVTEDRSPGWKRLQPLGSGTPPEPDAMPALAPPVFHSAFFIFHSKIWGFKVIQGYSKLNFFRRPAGPCVAEAGQPDRWFVDQLPVIQSQSLPPSGPPVPPPSRSIKVNGMFPAPSRVQPRPGVRSFPNAIRMHGSRLMPSAQFPARLVPDGAPCGIFSGISVLAFNIRPLTFSLLTYD